MTFWRFPYDQVKIQINRSRMNDLIIFFDKCLLKIVFPQAEKKGSERKLEEHQWENSEKRIAFPQDGGRGKWNEKEPSKKNEE